MKDSKKKRGRGVKAKLKKTKQKQIFFLDGFPKEVEAADALSKMDMKRFRENMPGADLGPQEVPGALLAWLEDPLPDRMLGHKILMEMKDYVELLKY